MSGLGYSVSGLGFARSGSELIPGDPGALTQLGLALSALANDFSVAASTIRSVDAGAWKGEAADAFRRAIHQQPGNYSDAAWAFSTAGGAVQAYASELASAQAQAGRALTEWDSAQSATYRWRNAGDPHSTKAPVQDPGQAGRSYAERQLSSAHAQLDAAASRLKSSLSSAAAKAPRKPSLFHQMFHDVAALGHQAWHYRAFFELVSGTMIFDPKTMWHYSEGFATGLWDMGKGTLLGIVGLAKFDIAFIRDPQGTLLSVGEHGTELVEAVEENPVAFAKAIANWDEFKSDPARWLGTLAPDVMLAVLTKGTGNVAEAAQVVDGLNKVGDVGNLMNDLNQPNTQKAVDQSADVIRGELQGGTVDVLSVPYVEAVGL